jgi:hypothetical protein
VTEFCDICYRKKMDFNVRKLILIYRKDKTDMSESHFNEENPMGKCGEIKGCDSKYFSILKDATGQEYLFSKAINKILEEYGILNIKFRPHHNHPMYRKDDFLRIEAVKLD